MNQPKDRETQLAMHVGKVPLSVGNRAFKRHRAGRGYRPAINDKD